MRIFSGFLGRGDLLPGIVGVRDVAIQGQARDCDSHGNGDDECSRMAGSIGYRDSGLGDVETVLCGAGGAEGSDSSEFLCEVEGRKTDGPRTFRFFEGNVSSRLDRKGGSMVRRLLEDSSGDGDEFMGSDDREFRWE